MTKLTAEWVKKAEGDFQAAQALRKNGADFYEQICFHCQQASEKYLKAVVQEDGNVVRRTHDLEVLLAQILPQHRKLRGFRRGLRFLTQFAVETRYPGKNPTKRQVQAALRWAVRVRAICRTILGIH